MRIGVQDLNSVGLKLMTHFAGCGKRRGTACAFATLVDFKFQGLYLKQSRFADRVTHVPSVCSVIVR
jgi:hypothetical protein